MKRLILVILIIIPSLLFAKVIDPNAPAGSRKNPVPIGSGYGLMVEDIWGKQIANVQILVGGVLRGDEALALVKSQNMFNEDPPTGYEYVIPLVYVANHKDLTGDDEYYYVNQSEFEFADAGYSHKPQYGVVLNEPLILDCKLYEGSYTIGIMAFIAPENDECYLYFQGIWFELGDATIDPEKFGYGE